jgi:hypothetical protein
METESSSTNVQRRPPCHPFSSIELQVARDWDHYLEACPTCGTFWFVGRSTIHGADAASSIGSRIDAVGRKRPSRARDGSATGEDHDRAVVGGRHPGSVNDGCVRPTWRRSGGPDPTSRSCATGASSPL